MRSRCIESVGAKRPAPFGYTLVELLVALTLGVLVLNAAIAFLITHMRTLEGSDIREDVTRNGRYIGVLLRRDVQTAGIDIESTTSSGAVAVWPGSPADTLVILHVPYLPSPAPPHNLIPPPGSENPLPPGGTCGTRCVDLLKDANDALELGVGDLARLQVSTTRRLIVIENISTTSDTSVALTFTNALSILRQPAGLTNGLRLDRFTTYVQKLTPIVYYLDDQARLIRALRLNMDGTPAGDVIAYGVEAFDAQLVFADGDELEWANPEDADNTNDYDDIVAVKIRTTVRAERPDPRVNQGELLRRTYQWLIAPRNLRDQRNRL